MSWTYDDPESEYYLDLVYKEDTEKCVRAMTVAQRQAISRCVRELNNLTFKMMFNGVIAKFHPRYYFNQLKYIKGTYIRKDRFVDSITPVEVEYINPIREISDELAIEFLIRIEMQELLMRRMGVPLNNHGEESK